MSFAQSVALLFAIAAAASLTASGLASLCGPLDAPNHRSSHAFSRPRAGGLAFLFGVAAALLAFAMGAGETALAAIGPDQSRIALILIAAGAAGALGLADDMSLIGLGGKFAGILAASVLAVAAAGSARVLDVTGATTVVLPLAVAWIGSVLWVFAVANAVNFMDGVDGMLAAGLGAPALGLALLGFSAGAPAAGLCGLVLAAVLIGFAPANLIASRVFAGDAGALFAGVLFAAAGLDLARSGAPGAVWCAPLLLTPYLADVLSTLLARLLRGANLAEGHREHVYQLLTARGWPHWTVSLAYAGSGLVCAAAAGLALPLGPLAALITFAVVFFGGFAGLLALRIVLRSGRPLDHEAA